MTVVVQGKTMYSKDLVTPTALGAVAQQEAPTSWIDLIGTVVQDKQEIIFHTLKKDGEKLLNSKGQPYGYFSLYSDSHGLVTIFCHNAKMYSWANGLSVNQTISVRCPEPRVVTNMVQDKPVVSKSTTGVGFITREVIVAKQERRQQRQELQSLLSGTVSQVPDNKGLIRKFFSKIW